jgi:hypothetical protein
MTYLASDNARNRRRAQRAAERNTSVTGCTDRVLRAVTAPNWRVKADPEFVTREDPEYRKVNNPYGQITNARQKMRGKSIPLI